MKNLLLLLFFSFCIYLSYSQQWEWAKNGFGSASNTSKFTIESSEKISSVVITNLLGENVYSINQSINLSTIDFSNKPKGIYFVEIVCGEERRR